MPEPRAHRTRRRAAVAPWVWFLVAGGLAALVFAVSGEPRVQAAAQVSVYVASWLALVSRWRRGRRTGGDRLLTVAVVAFGTYFGASTLGALVPLVFPSETAVPVPSALDGLFLLSYVLLGAFLWGLGTRAGGAGRRDVLDILIVVGGLVPVFWSFLIAPVLQRGSPPGEALTLAAYPVSVFGLVAMTVRLAFLSRRRSAVHLLLAGWIVAELSADLVLVSSFVTDSYRFGQAWQALWILSAACVGAMALHPWAPRLLARRQPVPADGAIRLWVLAGCLATPLMTLVCIEAAGDRDQKVVVAALVSVFLVGLLCLRLSGLMVDNAAQLRDQERLERLTRDLAHQARHDPLTGLGNRLLFAEHADAALAAAYTGDGGVGILLLDLDDFKMVNDTFGHDAGDRVLVEVAQRLKRLTAGGLGVYRLGGDEFALLLPACRVEDAEALACRISRSLTEPFDLGPREVRPVGCMGISIARDGQSRNDLLAEADLAMFAGKARGSGVPCVFDPALHRATLERHQLERELREAAAGGELRLRYQPLVDIVTTEVVGVEALVRWEHPRLGTLGPVDFIALAESCGAIFSLGDWVLQESLRQLRAWDVAVPAHRRRCRPLRISVNVSPRQLGDPDFVARTATVLERSGLDPARVTLEITEAAFGEDADTMIERLHELKALGVLLAIDDFGTEYSSLSKLRQIPVDVLKIDKSFVVDIATDPSERAVAAAIVNLATSLGKDTVAEGIECEGQRAELRRLGVRIGQGYLFARPVDADGIADRLRLDDRARAVADRMPA